VPPYVIFHDSVLRDMATGRPGSIAELGRISGVGARKLEAYGDAFLQVIRESEG
jgi:ATP-dependent DNA helicase RecQ